MTKSNKEFKMLAKTLFGLEEVLADELSALGAKEIKKANRAVEFLGDKTIMYKANLHLRTALRILVPLHSFEAKDQTALYNGIKEINWNEYLSISNTFIVKPVANSKYFKHSKFAAQKAKDAIVDQLRDEKGKRPSVSLESPDLVVDLHIAENIVTVSLDSSGKPLNQRGYRRSGGDAPLNEVLAAGMILLSKWDKKSNFIDPMCGSGTLLIEAAMIASNQAPNILRQEYSFMKWGNFDSSLWNQIHRSAKEEISIPDKKKLKIVGSDIALQKLEIAQRNISTAGFTRLISLRNKPFDKFIPPSGGGFMLCNPPYGERLKVKEIDGFYTTIGNCLKYFWKNYQAWILSSNFEAFKNIGLKSDVKIKLFNGKLECRYQNFPIFEGKRADYLEKTKEK